MKNNRLSHSAVSTYQSCPKKYEFHYLHKLRTIETTGALLFGTAIDKSIELLVNGYKEKSDQLLFTELWEHQFINNVRTYIPTSLNVVYSDTDYDEELLTSIDIQFLQTTYGSNVLDQVKEIQKEKKIKSFKGLNVNQKKILNHANWLSLRNKGIYMLQAFREYVAPKIKKVLGTQLKIELKNNTGDSIIGYVDLVCEYEGYDKPVIIDFKTSSIEYSKDSVATSPQLTIYRNHLAPDYNDTRYAGFIVFDKRIRKNKIKTCDKCGKDGTGQRHKTCDNNINNVRCNGDWIEKLDPKCYVSIIIDEIPMHFESIVLDNYEQINQLIKSGVFVRNLQSCQMAWGPCQFKKLCFNGKDDSLIVVDKDEKK